MCDISVNIGQGAVVDGSGHQALADTFERLVADRHSCRAFLPGPVPHEQIVRLLRTAQRSPSWCNTQPWQALVTEGDATARLREALTAYAREQGADVKPDIQMPQEYTGVHQERRRASGWQLYDAVGVARGDRAASATQAFKNFELFGAPHAAIITVDASQGAYGALDAGVYVANFLLAAQSMGIGAIAQAALANYAPLIREFFEIPADRAVLLAISFGWPDRRDPANNFRTDRADLDEVAKWISD